MHGKIHISRFSVLYVKNSKLEPGAEKQSHNFQLLRCSLRKITPQVESARGTMKFLFLLVIPALVQGMNTEQATYQSSQGTSSSNRILGLNLVNRLFVPYGPDVTQSHNETVFTGFGFGMDAVDAVGYDYVEKYIYSKSDFGAFVTIIDYSSFPAEVTPYSLTLTSWNSGLHDIAICPQQGLFFVSIGDVEKVLVFSTVKRSSPATPKLINVLDTGLNTDMIGVNPDCTILAVAISNNNMAPGVNLVTNFGTSNSPTFRKVRFPDCNVSSIQ